MNADRADVWAIERQRMLDEVVTRHAPQLTKLLTLLGNLIAAGGLAGTGSLGEQVEAGVGEEGE